MGFFFWTLLGGVGGGSGHPVWTVRTVPLDEFLTYSNLELTNRDADSAPIEKTAFELIYSDVSPALGIRQPQGIRFFVHATRLHQKQ